MANVTRFDPFQISSIDPFDEVFKGFFRPVRSEGSPGAQFRMDVKEDDKGYTVHAEIPGVKKEEIKLGLNDGRLSISVEREEKVDEEKENYVHRERRYGSYERCVYLADANPDGIEAKLEDGLLKIVVPKQDKDEGKRNIEIK